MRLELARRQLQNNDTAAAEHALSELVDQAPQYHLARFELAKLQYDQSQYINCLLNTRKLLHPLWDQSSVWLLQGLTMTKMDSHAEAITAFEHALELDADSEMARLNLCQALFNNKEYERAISALQTLAQMYPDNTSAIISLSTAALAIDDYDLTLSVLEQIAKRGIDNLDSYKNRGICNMRMNNLEQAIDSLQRATEADPQDPAAHYILGMAHLKAGHYSVGWQEYEHRWRSGESMVLPPRTSIPLWRGEPLTGSHLLVTCEQGVGDNIQFSRVFLSLSERTGLKHLSFVCSADYACLFEGMQGIDTLIPSSHAKVDADYYCPLISIMARLDCAADDIRVPVPYLHPDRHRLEKWHGWLEARSDHRPCIGICWNGSALNLGNHLRSIPLPEWQPLFEMQQVHWVSLQYQGGDELLAQGLGGRVLNPMTKASTFADTAALIACMDLVVTIDTSVAHIAGALNQPVWTLLAKSGDWRYLTEVETCPWYPSMRLLRAPRFHSWGELIECAQGKLAELFPG